MVLIPVVTTFVLSVVFLVIGIVAFSAHRSWKMLIRFIGCTIITIGLYFLGIISLVTNGIQSIVAWMQRITWTSTMTYALIAVVVGIIAVVVSQFLPAGQKSTPKELPTKAPESAESPTTDPADAEIEALLNRRGIK